MRSSAIVVLTSLLFATGCVSLDKPTKVANCSVSTAGCSDQISNPPEPGRDASLPDAGPTNPDLPGEEVQVVPKDAPSDPDVPPADAPQEALPDALAPDGHTNADVASPDVLSPDVLPDLSIEAPGGAETGPDAGKFDSADVGSNDVGSDGRFNLGPDTATTSNCVGQLISAGYVAGSAPACSKCLENGASLESKCKAMIDCLAPPCTKTTCYTNNYCQNTTGASSVVGDCVAALITAACPGGF